jgi:hypothetical protein
MTNEETPPGQTTEFEHRTRGADWRTTSAEAGAPLDINGVGHPTIGFRCARDLR